MSWFFTWSSQSTGVSDSTWVVPINIQEWSPLGWTGWISLQSKGFSSLLQHHSSKVSILWCSAFLMVQLSHPYMWEGIGARKRKNKMSRGQPIKWKEIKLHDVWEDCLLHSTYLMRNWGRDLCARDKLLIVMTLDVPTHQTPNLARPSLKLCFPLTFCLQVWVWVGVFLTLGRGRIQSSMRM